MARIPLLMHGCYKHTINNAARIVYASYVCASFNSINNVSQTKKVLLLPFDRCVLCRSDDLAFGPEAVHTGAAEILDESILCCASSYDNRFSICSCISSTQANEHNEAQAFLELLSSTRSNTPLLMG